MTSIEKHGRHWYAETTLEVAFSEQLTRRFRTEREAREWIASIEETNAAYAANMAEDRAARLANARRYLAERAARREAQSTFAF